MEEAAVWVISLKCSAVVVQDSRNNVDLRKASPSNTHSKSLSKKFILESKPRLLSTEREFALLAMDSVAKKALSRSVALAKDAVW